MACLPMLSSSGLGSNPSLMHELRLAGESWNGASPVPGGKTHRNPPFILIYQKTHVLLCDVERAIEGFWDVGGEGYCGNSSTSGPGGRGRLGTMAEAAPTEHKSRRNHERSLRIKGGQHGRVAREHARMQACGGSSDSRLTLKQAHPQAGSPSSRLTLKQAHPQAGSPSSRLTLKQAHPQAGSPSSRLTLKQAHPQAGSPSSRLTLKQALFGR